MGLEGKGASFDGTGRFWIQGAGLRCLGVCNMGGLAFGGMVFLRSASQASGEGTSTTHHDISFRGPTFV